MPNLPSVFEEAKLNSTGDKIPDEIDKTIREEILIPEDFEDYVLLLAESNESVGKLLKDLREPRPGGKTCIPWLGETDVKEKLLRICAHGDIAINVRGTDHLQAKPGEDAESAWNRMKGKLGTAHTSTRHSSNCQIVRQQVVVKVQRQPWRNERQPQTFVTPPNPFPNLFGGTTPPTSGNRNSGSTGDQDQDRAEAHSCQRSPLLCVEQRLGYIRTQSDRSA